MIKKYNTEKDGKRQRQEVERHNKTNLTTK